VTIVTGAAVAKALGFDTSATSCADARELWFKTTRLSGLDQLRAELVEVGVLGATTEWAADLD
jgi:hypothetical protein